MQHGIREAALARLRALLNLPAAESVPSFALAHAMEHHAHSDNASLASDTPAIAALRAEVERAEQDIRLAKLATKPDFNIEASDEVFRITLRLWWKAWLQVPAASLPSNALGGRSAVPGAVIEAVGTQPVEA